LPVQVPDMVELGPAPYIRPLAALANDHCASLVVLLDTRRARIFDTFMGSLSEIEEMDPPTDLDVQSRDGGAGRAGNKKLSRHKQENTKLHYKDVSAKLMALIQDHGYEQLLVGGAKAAVEGLIPHLHPYLAERLGGTFTCDLGSPPAIITEAINGLQQEAHRNRQEILLAKLADNLGPRGLAATGLNDVLACLHEGQVHTLFVRRGYTAGGGSCHYCGRLRHVAGDCPLCWSTMTAVADVVNLAVAKALESGAKLEQIDGDSKLDDLGGIAALLRYA
jgi:peptide chain release factor subunit 1